MSLDASSDSESDRAARDYRLCDPAPEPDAHLEEVEIAARLHSLLRAQAEPATRVMLAYARCVGTLAEAAEDYLLSLHELARARLGSRAPSAGAPALGQPAVKELGAMALPIELKCKMA